MSRPLLDRTRLAAAGQAVAGIALVAALSDDEGMIFCPFRRTTDGYCPLCGGTRAAGKLLTGDLAGSWSRHPLVILLAVQLPVLAAMMWRSRASGQNATIFERWLYVNLGLAMVIWLWRLGIDAVPRPETLQSPLPNWLT